MTKNDLNDNLKSTLLIDNQIVKTNNTNNNLLAISEAITTVFLASPEEHIPSFLQTVKSIAQACQLSEMDYIILPSIYPWHLLRQKEKLKNIVLFGAIEAQLELNILLPLHYIYSFDQRTWIKTLNLNQLTQDKNAKTELWNTALKKHFLP